MFYGWPKLSLGKEVTAAKYFLVSIVRRRYKGLKDCSSTISRVTSSSPAKVGIERSKHERKPFIEGKYTKELY